MLKKQSIWDFRKKRKSRRKKDNDSNRLKKAVLAGIAAFLSAFALVVMAGWNGPLGGWIRSFSAPVVRQVDILGINSPYAILIQARGGSVIAASRPDEQIYPASLTKLMTVLVALEKLKNLDSTTTLRPEIFAPLYEQDASRAGFEPGETVSARDLLYGAMLPSGAECCLGLADMIAGSEEDFVVLMNQKAARLGMKSTHFTNTTGLQDPEHYSTVRDLSVLMKYAIRKKNFRILAETEVYHTSPDSFHPDGITLYSTLFRNLPDPSVTGGQILGGKTGYTEAAGQCLASYASIEGREYILVTCGAVQNGNPLHIYDAQTLYNRVGEAAQNLA